jgi:2-octaprenylphenol hydroxylase
MAESLDCDVVIVGGGLVGATLACALGKCSLSVRLVEARPPAPLHADDPLDPRVSAFTRASERILENLDVWDRTAAERRSPFREMHVWDATGSGAIHFDSAWVGEPYLGHIVENRAVLTGLQSRLEGLSNVRSLCPAAVVDVAMGADRARVQLAEGGVLGARVLVAADGSASRVRRLAEMPVRGRGSPQKAVVAVVTTSRGHRETAWQRFLPTGPLAFLPVFDGRCSIVWSTRPEEADALCAMEGEAFLARLEEAAGGALGSMRAVEGRAAFPLRRQYAPSYVGPRLALVGDAAHTIHPLAGQGVNLGLLDAAAMAEVLLEGAARGRDIGSLRVLRRYERWRKGDNLAMLLLMEGFRSLFGARSEAVRWLRNLGLTLVDGVEPLKAEIIRRAMGLRGDLPVLARPRFGQGLGKS